jgi:[CysO sulfur-carrier protein]-S-L-cysteine hydrolase
MSEAVYQQMVGHCYDGLPLEACGLLGGVGEKAIACYPAENMAHSSKLYEIGHRDYIRAEDDADARGLEIMAVFHSHTHTDAYPSPTDVERAGVPTWHYVLVSLRDIAPVVRSYRIVDGNIIEEQVVMDGR